MSSVATNWPQWLEQNHHEPGQPQRCCGNLLQLIPPRSGIASLLLLRQRVPPTHSRNSYVVSGKDMSSQMKYIHARGGKIVSITEVM